MKKYILLLVTALSFAQASNQMVSFTQAQSLGFSLKSGQSHITSNQCMTKTEALAKYNLDTAAMNSYASNQLVPRSAWVSGTTNFTSTLTVGAGANGVYGYNVAGFGSMSNINTPIAQSDSYITALGYSTLDLALSISIYNGSTTTPPSGWTTLSINGSNYSRVSFSIFGSSGVWTWSLNTSNTIGTTAGATRTITLL